MPSPSVVAQTALIASRTSPSITLSPVTRARQRCVYADHTRFSPVGTGPVRPRDVGDDPMWNAIVPMQSLMTRSLISPRINTSVGPRSRGTPMDQNHQLPSGSVYLL